MIRLEPHIRAAARQLGFALCAFAPADTPLHGAFVRHWLDDGNAAGMAYIARGLDRRLDVCRVLPAVRTVITLGYRYVPPPLPPVDWRAQLRGRIAAYAFGTDYHVVIADKLRQLAGAITALQPDAVTRAYVDSGPILERDWAAAGGVGWFGKNTNILHTEHGSYFFLAELLSTVELEPDTPLPDHCGTCTRCLELCPTGALRAGYVLDARRCISYWTIEHRGVIPAAMRPQLGNWVFGCDVCQEVCPWNEKMVRRDGAPEAAALLPYLPELLAFDDEAFRRRFRHSAIQRTKREGLLRNAAIVLGNSGNPAAVAPLARALAADPSAVVRAHAAWALGALGDRAARRALESARRREPAALVRVEIQTALASIYDLQTPPAPRYASP